MKQVRLSRNDAVLSASSVFKIIRDSLVKSGCDKREFSIGMNKCLPRVLSVNSRAQEMTDLKNHFKCTYIDGGTYQKSFGVLHDKMKNGKMSETVDNNWL